MERLLERQPAIDDVSSPQKVEKALLIARVMDDWIGVPLNMDNMERTRSRDGARLGCDLVWDEALASPPG